MLNSKKGAIVYLAWANFCRRRRGSTMAVILSAIAVCSVILIGSISSRISSGLTLSGERMGADVVIYPQSAAMDDSQLLFSGVAKMVYMDDSMIAGKLPQDQIEAITPQFFLQTLPGAGCCATDETFRIVGVDPKSDFVVSPWYDLDQWEEDELLIGANVSLQEHMKIFLLNDIFRVAGRLPWTGSAVDNSIYIHLDKSRSIALERFSREDYHYFDETQDLSHTVTSYLIKLNPGVDPEGFVEEAKANGLEAEIVAVSSTRTALRQQMQLLTQMLWAFSGCIVLTSALALYAFYSNTFHNRTKEIGYLRSIGFGKGNVMVLILLESGFGAGVGGVLGTAAGLAAVNPMLERLQALLILPLGSNGSGFFVTAVLGVTGALAVSWIAAILPGLRSAGMDPATAITEGEI